MARKIVKAKKSGSKAVTKKTAKRKSAAKKVAKKSVSKKTTSKKTTSKKTTSRKKIARRPGAARVRIRMYRLGVGDCFLLSFPRAGASDFHMLIDCGVHQSQSGGGDRIRSVVADLHTATGGRLDVIVVTHEHMDHISGFKQAADLFKTFAVGDIWFAWTEDDKDTLAQELAGRKDKALHLLEGVRQRMRLLGADSEDNPLAGIMGFFGGGAGKQLAAAGAVLKGLSKNHIYHRPGDPPIELPDIAARIFVLGPPRDTEMIGKSDPSKKDSEVYELAVDGTGGGAFAVNATGQASAIFGARFILPLVASKGIAFFDRHYWSDNGPDIVQDREDTGQDWRRIETDWLDMESTTSLALKLDQDTNNTSLVLAIELGPKDKPGEVLLFAADAQVGNWLSWQKVEWADCGGRKVTGPDLLRRTRIYKVGHHASHNATLAELGLQMMDSLELALVPTDAEMAKKVKWGTLPWPPLLKALDEKTQNRVVRSDIDGAQAPGLTETPLYYEVSI